ncbi:MAG: SH3 domain-containing protein [Anaerolineales bacterium]|nr:SH3 domain-containing protein [Anaerolineales bacterium]
MTKYKTLFIFLPLLVMACSLTAQNAALHLQAGRQINPADPPPLTCRVKTGLQAGKVNLRACGGTDCPVLIILHEDEPLTQTQAVNGWLAVETASGLHGWVNSKYADCMKGK